MENSKVRKFNNPLFLDSGVSNSQIKTFSTFQNLLHRLTVLAQSRFNWVNLPENLTSRHIEQGLFKFGSVVFHKNLSKDTIYNGRYFALPYTHESLDMYGDPVNLRAYGLDGYSHSVISGLTGVIIRNNIIGSNTIDTIIMYVSRLTEAYRSRDVNIHNTKSTTLYKCNEAEKLTLETLIKKADDFEPRIFGVKSMADYEKVDVLNTKIDFIADKITDYKDDLFDEVLTFLGIKNSNKKRERMILDEVESNNDFANTSINTMLESRKEACKEINRIYGLNIDVELNNVTFISGEESEMEENGDDNSDTV